MAVTISAANGAGTTSPLTSLSPYSTARPGRNVVHRLIGGGIAVSIAGADLRAGTVEFLYDDETAANAALDLHAEPTSFVLTDTDRPSVSMSYVVDGDVGLRLDDATLRTWVLSVAYQEVEA